MIKKVTALITLLFVLTNINLIQSTIFGFAQKNTDELFISAFSASVENDIAVAKQRGGAIEEAEIVNFSSKSVSLTFEGQTDRTRRIVYQKELDVSDATHLNAWIYSPEATGYTARLLCYSDVANWKYCGANVITIDWTGWKLHSFEVDYDTIDGIGFNMGGWNTKDKQVEDSILICDEIWFSDKAPSMNLVSSSFNDGYKDAEVFGETLELEFSSEINPDKTPVISFTDKDGNVIKDYEVSINSNVLKITFGLLAQSSFYNITIDKVEGVQPVRLNDKITISFSTKRDPERFFEFISTKPDNGAKEIDASEPGFEYLISFDSEINSEDVEDKITVTQNGKAFDEYVLNCMGEVIKLKFLTALEGNSVYEITVSENLRNTYNVSLGENLVFSFTTARSNKQYFEVISTSVENGAVVGALESYEFEFNNEPAGDTSEFISLYKNGQKQYNACTFEKSGTVVTVLFTKELVQGSEYSFKISDYFMDKYSNMISGQKEFRFLVASQENTNYYITAFSASNESDISIAKQRGGALEETENTNLYSKAIRMDFEAYTDRARRIVYQKELDVSDCGYLNAWLYSPKATGYNVRLICYSDVANWKSVSVSPLIIDWTGWKLITLEVKCDKIDGIGFNVGGWNEKDSITEDSYLLCDEIWFSDHKPSLTLEHSSFPDGYPDALVSGEVLKLDFSSELNDAFFPDIVLTDNTGTELYDFDFQISESSLTVEFGTLMPDTAYTITIDGVVGIQPVKLKNKITINFTTNASGVAISGIGFEPETLIPGEVFKAIYSIENTHDMVCDLDLHIVAADEDNVLLESVSKTVNVSASHIVEELLFTCPQGTNRIIAYALDKNGRISGGKYIELTEEGTKIITTGFVGGEGESISITSANLTGSILEITGMVSSMSNAIRVKISGEKILSSGIAHASTDGNFSYYYVFPEDIKTGEYTVVAEGLDASDSKLISYISGTDRDELLKLSNSDSESELEDFLENIEKMPGLRKITSTEVEEIAKYIIAQDEFSSYTSVMEFIEKMLCIMDRLYVAQWSDVTNIILDVDSILGETNDDVKYYICLKEEERNKICEKIAKKLPADSVNDFLDKLSESIDAYTTSLKDKGSSSGSGGSVGGKTSASTTFPTTNSTPYIPVEAENIFSDIYEASWAKESIMNLYNLGIVSYPIDGKFRPNEMITREEFVKMIVCAFTDGTANYSHSFTDVVSDAWYNEYLDIAFSYGISHGYPDGRFGIGENITREDMVTLCARTLEVLGNSLPEAHAVFSDREMISDYAADYIGSMTQLGVINGMGDGRFAPKSNATRAEAAKVIAKLVELY